MADMIFYKEINDELDTITASLKQGLTSITTAQLRIAILSVEMCLMLDGFYWKTLHNNSSSSETDDITA